MKLLAIGDSHIPRRARDVDVEVYSKISELTESELFEFTFFTGDVIKAPKLMDFLNLKTKKDVFVVIGNMDYFDGNRGAPLFHSKDLKIGNETLRIGLTHGAQVSPRGDHDQLESIANEHNFNILISGHTHHEEIFLTEKGILLLNPGSVTGAWSFVASLLPSFIVINIGEKSGDLEVHLIQKQKKSVKMSETKFSFIFKDNIIENK